MSFDNAKYAVIFTSTLKEHSEGYHEMASHLEEVAKNVQGFLGIQSARGNDGFGISISYWKDMESIENWKNHPKHRIAKEKGIKDWYKNYSIKITKIAVE